MSQSKPASPQQGHLQEHIDLIAKHEQEFLAQRTNTEKLGDRMASFIGSLIYVAMQRPHSDGFNRGDAYVIDDWR